MNPALLIPQVEPLPVPSIWFDILLILTFTAHVLFMNALFGSAVVGFYHILRGKHQLAKEIGKKLPPLLALTINLGVAPLLFLQVNYGHFDYVSSALMGGWWLAVIAVLILAYYGFYIYKFSEKSMSMVWRNAIYCSSILGLLYVGFMFSNNMTLMLAPEAWLNYFTKSGSFLNLGDPTLTPRFLHFIVGAIAVGGLFVALLGKRIGREELVQIGLKWCIHATLTNIILGIWFLFSLPETLRPAFLGQSIHATGSLVVGTLSTCFMLFSALKQRLRLTTVWAFLTVFFMVCTRHFVRTLSLKPWFHIDTTPVTNQYGSLYLFFAFLVIGGGLIWYMISLYLKSSEGRA